MQIEKINNNEEKYIVIGLITSDKFCKEIIPVLDISLFKTNLSRIIIQWCIDYYNKYNKSIQKDIQSVFKKHEEDTDPDLYDLIEEFLSSLNGMYVREDNYNENYAIDQAINYLRIRKLKELKKSIDYALINNQLDEADNLVNSYVKIEKENINVIDIFVDDNKIREALEYEEEVLFQFPGVLGELLHNFLRGDLISFAAPAKRGKSFWLIEMGIKCLLYGLRVVFFSFEMTREQMIQRIFQNILAETKTKENTVVNIPIFIWNEQSEKYDIEYKELKKKGISVNIAIKKKNKIKNMIKRGSFKLVCAPPESMTVQDIANITDKLYKKEGFVPDVYIIDYMDIVLSKNKGEYRHKIDDKWKGAKNLALAKYALVITATHTNKSTYKKDVEQDDMSEDTRKMNHVSTMIGLNQNKKEKKIGIMRLQSLASRHEEFTMDDVVVLYNLKIGKPFLDAKHRYQVNMESIKELIDE